MRIQLQNNVANSMFEQKSIGKNTNSSLKGTISISNAYKVTISEEAQNNYHTYVNNLNGSANHSNVEADLYRELLSKSVVDITGLTQSNFHTQFMHQNTQIRDGKESNCSTTELSKSCFEVYTSMYDEIKSGYADGTREIWIVDSTTENGFRKVTEDEEIAALDSAYDFYAQVVDAYENSGDIGKKVENAMNKLQADLQNQKYVRTSQEDDADKGKADIHNRLLNAAQLWKNSYSVNTNNLASLFKQIFNSTVILG